MKKVIELYKKIPGWVVMLLLFGVLYLTGLHTEAIGQVQRVLLATGVRNADIEPEQLAVPEQVRTADGRMAGAGFTMQDLEGRVVDFGQLRGKVIFLNIWATWCPPCLAEMSNIQALYEQVGSEKIAFVMLSVDQKGREKVQKFIRRKGYTFPVYLPKSPLPQEFTSEAIPTTFIISPAGKIVATQKGMAQYNTPEVREYLQKLAR